MSSNILPFSERKKIGNTIELDFMEEIARMGGSARKIGEVEGRNEAPRFVHLRPSHIHDHKDPDEALRWDIAPDISFRPPNQPRGIGWVAEVKVKKIQTERGKAFIYLDEKQLHRMKLANSCDVCIFAIYIKDCFGIEGVEKWMIVEVDTLIATTFLKRTVSGNPTFCVPITLFRPLSELPHWRPWPHDDEPANTNAAPTGRCLREGVDPGSRPADEDAA